MGYAPNYFSSQVLRWLSEGWLPKGGRLIDFGAQEFHGDPDEARERTREFLASRGLSETEVTAAIGRRGKLEVASVYRAIGIDYVAIDVDGSHGSSFFDLNTFAPPPEWIGAFDMVNNEGTIEHLVNPINGFQVAHESLKVGGVAYHSVPLTGWQRHGLLYPTEKFYEALIWENSYDLLDRRIDRSGEGEWIALTYRKCKRSTFRSPFDHLTTPAAYSIGSRLTENWAVFSHRRFNGDHPKRVQMTLRRRLISAAWRVQSLFR
jgi:hypothetical protein